ncbi:MAG: protoheme IX farnesyltransferase [Bacteroidota bacterium]
MPFKEAVTIARELGKIRISLPVSLSALAGYTLLSGHVGWPGFLLAVGVLMMSCGSATINHIQESETDILMSRTRGRPIPSGRISVRGAIAVAAAFVVTGSLILLAGFPWMAFALSWITLLWYNLVYTPLKKITAFAVIPGSVTGALPPVIGWVAAGGGVSDPQILIVASFFFIGQIPHFWLLLLMFGDQYKEAGLPTLNGIFTPTQIKRISFFWILATIANAFLVIGYVFTDKILSFFVLLYVFFLVFSLLFRFLLQSEFHPRPAFLRLNLLYLFMMILLVVEGLLRH